MDVGLSELRELGMNREAWSAVIHGIAKNRTWLSNWTDCTDAEYLMTNAGLEEAQAGIRIARRNISNLRYAHDTTRLAESEEIKSVMMKVKEESEKIGQKLNIQKTKIMASSPVTSWQIDWETVAEFISLGSKITADGDCSY